MSQANRHLVLNWDVWQPACRGRRGNLSAVPAASDCNGYGNKRTFSDNTTGRIRRTRRLVEALERAMPDPHMMEVLDHAAHELLMWVGFGTLVGLSAKAIMPGRDPGGAVGTLLMGIAGSLIGCGVLLLFDTGFRVTPISPLGFAAGTGGAFLLLLFFRILSNSYIVEAVDGKTNATGAAAVTTYYRRRGRRAA
jgi:uncharacterized membrane protein YeaQ/YmgE (transglycosylase-associated protein family)